jgi:hypothetical protein
MIALVGCSLTILEVSSYMAFFYQMTGYNKAVAGKMLKPSVIKGRNRVNAISMIGQIFGWLMEIWYLLLISVLSLKYEMDFLREVSFLLKHFEFCLIPFVQIVTSNPISQFIETNYSGLSWTKHVFYRSKLWREPEK